MDVMVVSALLDIYAKYGRKTHELFDKMHDANKKYSYSCNFETFVNALYIMYNTNYLMLIISIYDARDNVIIDANNDTLFVNTLSVN